MAHKFLVHHHGDHVGVAVEDIPKNARVYGIYLDTDEPTHEVVTADDIPLGHKVALVDLGEGEPVLKYGVPIGLTRRPVRKGDYVHTHNLRSGRW